MMLYLLKIPDCKEQLLCILEFQRKLLEYAVDHKEIDEEGLEDLLGDQVFEWWKVSPTRTLLRDYFKPYLEEDELTKIKVLERFNCDIEFEQHIDESGFRLLLKFGLGSLSIKLQKFLMNFYEQLSQYGFPPALCRYEHQFTKSDWWRCYYLANPNNKTCPICDVRLDGNGTIEHYFPKGRYLAMSVHPANLIPCCKECNSGNKGGTDPFTSYSITELYIPYRRSIDQDTELTFEDNGTGKDKPRFIALTDNPLVRARLESMEYLYNVSEKWMGSIDSIVDIALHELQTQVSFYVGNGEELTEDLIRKCIEGALKVLRNGRGRFQYFYPASAWLSYAKDKKFHELCREVSR